MKKIEKQIQINAPKETVWKVLLEEAYNTIWMAEFREGTHAETDWIEGHKVRFLDGEKNGIVGTIESKRPYDKIEMIYEGEIKNGQDVFDSEMAQAVKGSRECYYLSENNGSSILRIVCEMDENWHEMMAAAWDKALLKIEALSAAI